MMEECREELIELEISKEYDLLDKSIENDAPETKCSDAYKSITTKVIENIKALIDGDSENRIRNEEEEEEKKEKQGKKEEEKAAEKSKNDDKIEKKEYQEQQKLFHLLTILLKTQEKRDKYYKWKKSGYIMNRTERKENK